MNRDHKSLLDLVFTFARSIVPEHLGIFIAVYKPQDENGQSRYYLTSNIQPHLCQELVSQIANDLQEDIDNGVAPENLVERIM